MYWADEIAEKVIARSPGKTTYHVHDYKTPSGRIHVGALCGVIIHGVVARAIAAKGHNVEYVYGFDDYDPMDGFPVYLPDSFRQYMGMPLSEIPSPEDGYTSFAELYAQEFITVFNQLGFTPKIIRMSEFYKAGKLNDAIRLVLDNAPRIREIYKEVSRSEKPSDWYGLNVVCPNCGKIGTTRVYDWDGSQVSFVCEPAMVKWAEGCGYKGKIDPFDGRSKLPWKVEWAAKWWLFGEDLETAGKDHMTKGGSFDVAAAISREVFSTEPPVGREFPYEWLLIGGRKMSSSKGTGASAKEVAALLPAHLLNFFIAKGKINRHKEFSPDGNTMPLLYDEYDKALVAYHSDPDSDLAKAIQYTKTENQHIPYYTMRFTKVAFLSQMPNVNIWDIARAEKGSELSPEDEVELTERLAYAAQWLADFAPDEYKFILQSELPAVTLTSEQKEFIAKLYVLMLEAGELTGAELHEKIHALKTELTISPKEAFGAIYQLFLAKDSGPQAGWFLAALDREFVLHRLKQVSE